jgi:hypothetical protein
MPAYLEITTVVHCVNVCDYCPQSLLIAKYNNVPERRMSFETFKTCIDKIPNDVIIDFSGYAEPFLNQRAADMMIYANEKGYKIRLFTTLVGLTIETINKISHINFLSTILHLPDEDGLLKTDVNDKYLECARLFKEKIRINSSHVYGKPHPKLFLLFPNQRRMEATNQDLHTRANNVKTSQIELKPHNYITGNIDCDVIRREGGTLLNHNVLLPNGDVMACCMDYGLEHRFGNLLTDTYEDLFKSEGYKYLIEGLKADASYDILCRTCKEAVNI